MKHPLVLILLLLFCCLQSNAQIEQTGTVTVKFIDEQQKPIDGLLVQLMKTSDSTLVLSSFSGSNGIAQFINVKKGNYFIYIAQFGYDAYKSSAFVIDNASQKTVLPDVVLHTKILKEVTIVSQVPFVEKQPDMTIVNVDKSPMSAGSSTMEILERSPGVIVDENDNINLQGKAGVTIMIDGKKVAMSGSELADMLRAMPADAIEKIELINNPGAKYDAAGTGGIINIVLKKGKLLGINGTVSGSYGQGMYPKVNGGFTLNDRTKNFNLFLNYTYSYRKNLKDITMEQNFYNGSQLTENTQQYSNYVIPNYFNILHAGADFFASDKTTIGFVFDGNIRKYQYNESSNSTTDSVGLSPSYSTSTASDNGNESQLTGELNFKHRYDSSGNKTLSATLNYMNYTFNDIQRFMNNYPTNENSFVQAPLIYGQIPFVDKIYIFQADYSTLLKNKAKIEAGLKTSYVSLIANTRFFLGTDNTAPIDTAQTEDFTYQENIIAGYLTYSKSFKHSDVSIGLRTEETIATGNLITEGNEFKRNYLYWFPHITYADTLNHFNNLEISAGTRFNRPDYDELNPFKNYTNPTTYSQGNPGLVPEYEYDINVSDVFKSIYVFTLSYAGTQHPIDAVHAPAPGEPGVTLITQQNLQWNNYYGFNISASPQIKRWWTSNNYAEVFYNQYIANVSQTPINTGKFIFNANSDNNFSLGNKFSIELTGQYSSGGFWGYFQSSARWSVGGGIQGKLLKDKCTIKLSVNDVFNTYYFNSSSTVLNYSESYLVRRDSRIAAISIAYRFGKSYLPEEDKSKNNDHVRDNPGNGL